MAIRPHRAERLRRLVQWLEEQLACPLPAKAVLLELEQSGLPALHRAACRDSARARLGRPHASLAGRGTPALPEEGGEAQQKEGTAA